MKTSELIGPALDWAVAKCEGLEIYQAWEDQINVMEGMFWIAYSPSTDWSQGGPIIEREKMHPYYMPEGGSNVAWRTEKPGEALKAGPTLLVAAMRCYVASKLGDTVDIPEELCV